MAMTMAEKVLARASGRASVRPGDYVTAGIDRVMTHEGFAGCYRVLSRAGVNQVWDPERIVVLLDHSVPPPDIASAETHKLVREGVARYGIKNWYDMKAGICHQVMPERGHVIPGELVLGCDSHTTTYGAFGTAATGIGVSEMAYVLATGELWLKVPPTLRFVLSGEFAPRVTSKDLILHIAGKYTTEVA